VAVAVPDSDSDMDNPGTFVEKKEDEGGFGIKLS